MTQKNILISLAQRKHRLSMTAIQERIEKRKIRMSYFSLIIAATGVLAGVLLFMYQIAIQKTQNDFQRGYQNRQFKLDSLMESKRFAYSIIEKSSELPTLKAVAANMDNYIDLELLPGEHKYYEKLSDAQLLDQIPFRGRQFAFDTDDKDLPLLEADNDTRNPCKAGPANGCWSKVIEASPGELISLQLYYHNTSDTVETNVAGMLSPEWTNPNVIHVFYGAIAANNEIDRDSVVINTIKPTVLIYVPHSIRVFPNQSRKPYTIAGEEFVFSKTGINLGDISPGWNHQSALVADFRVIAK